MPSIARIRRIKGNQICADCAATTKQPTYVSFLHGDESKLKLSISVDGLLAVLICDRCAQQHKTQLEENKNKKKKLCTVKSFENSVAAGGNQSFFTVKELQCIEQSGNEFVNRFYEAVNFNFDKTSLSHNGDGDDVATEKRRAKFIKAKYRQCTYRNDISLEIELRKLIDEAKAAAAANNNKKKKEEKTSSPNKTESSSSRSQSPKKNGKNQTKDTKKSAAGNAAKHDNKKKEMDSSGRREREESDSDENSATAKERSSSYANLASLVEETRTTSVSPSSTRRTRRTKTTPGQDNDHDHEDVMDTSKLYKIAHGFVKAHDKFMDFNHKSNNDNTRRGGGGGGFQDLSNKVDNLLSSTVAATTTTTTSNSNITTIDTTKLHKLTKAMNNVTIEVTKVATGDDEDNDNSGMDHSSSSFAAPLPTPTTGGGSALIKGLMDAKKFGDDISKEYDRQASKMHRTGQSVLQKSSS